ncbi:MAG: FKBP-type peptidyl-prolyl cis-trans isomerase [Chitinophagaceae bacterium]|nr:FKBP-type peptidyl-prolyl cis-trans isomerase [Chitinophagaceae bacterium]
MRNPTYPLALLFLALIASGCSKSKTCSPKSVAGEATQIQAFATSSGMNATQHSSGLFYEIVDPGSGATATLNSNIAITYTGTLLNGTIFDQQTTPNNTASNPPWPLGQLIEGWRLGIPLIKEGGHIKLIVPSAMAYGCTGYGIIPADAILYFDITLVDVQ